MLVEIEILKKMQHDGQSWISWMRVRNRISEFFRIAVGFSPDQRPFDQDRKLGFVPSQHSQLDSI